MGWSDDICVSPVSPVLPGWDLDASTTKLDASTTKLVVSAGSTVGGTGFAVGGIVAGDLIPVVTGVLLGIIPNNAN